jgi:hypothetical protein
VAIASIESREVAIRHRYLATPAPAKPQTAQLDGAQQPFERPRQLA